jgi:Na+/proline symporter
MQEDLDRKIVKRGRVAMIGITIAGLLVALAVIHIPGFGLKYLWWIFNTIAACVAVPTVLSLYWNRLDSRGVYWGVVIAFFIGIPLFVYSNIKEMIWLTVASSVGIIFITRIFALMFPRNTAFHPDIAKVKLGVE